MYHGPLINRRRKKQGRMDNGTGRSRFSAGKVLFSALVIIGCLLSLSCARQSQAEKPISLKEQMRPLWSPAAGEFVRNWLICGEFSIPSTDDDDSDTAQPAAGFANDFLQGHGGEKAIRPAAGKTHTRGDGTLATWTKYLNTSDTLEFYRAFEGHPSEDVVWYAFTTIQRSKLGKAIFSLDGNEAVKVWLNGELVQEHFITDESGYNDLFDVNMHAGENAVLIKVVQRSESGRIALRVLEMAQAEAMEMITTRLAPSIQSTEQKAGKLVVITDDRRSNLLPTRPPVEVRVVAPGGKVVASQTVPRGERATIDTARIPLGPYEITVSMAGINGKRVVAYLPWYRGDVIVAAKHLVETAPGVGDKTSDGMIHQMMSDLLKDRLGLDYTKAKPAKFPAIYQTLMEFAELEQAKAGGKGAERPNGFVRMTYRDEVDDSPQFCRVYLPADYSPEKRYPLIINLHGRDDQFPPYYKWGGVDQRHDWLADEYQAITVYPHARGNTWYRVLGDQDVMHCLAMVKQRFPVDDDRVYLVGYSMGGAGVWYVGTRHPEQFAAIAPSFGGYDFRFQLTDNVLNKLTPREQYRRERLSYIAQAEQLRTTPVLASHGDADNVVPVDYSRYTVRMLQRWGYDIRYWEAPGKAHGGLGNDREVFDWLLAQRRVNNPAHVSVRAADLRYAAAHWVKVTQRKDPYAFIQADAEVIAPNYIRLNTDNALEVVLSPKAPLIDPAKPVQLLWNNTEMRTVSFENGSVLLRAKGYTPPTLCKRPGVEGPANDIYNTPYAIVVGTISANPLMRRLCERAGLRLAAWWDERFHCKPRYFKDTEISEEDQAKYSLLLLGGPADNLVVQTLADRIPLKVAANAITVDAHTFPGHDMAIQMIYPNPLNPDRYVLIRAATSPTGMFFSDYVLNDVDYCIVDSHSADPTKMAGFFDGITGRNAGPPIVAGYFNNGWHFQDTFLERWTIDDKTRTPSWKVPQTPSAAISADRLMLSNLVETKAEGAFLDMLRDRSMTGKQMGWGWKHYDSGLAVAPLYWLPKQPCAVEYDLTGGSWTHLRGVIGLELPKAGDVSEDEQARVQFEFVVKGDGLELYHSAPFAFDTAPKQLNVDITGVTILRLEIINKTAGASPVKSVNWADLRVER